ncbi:class I SAM-dependent methyltransferase [Stenomitos frigidus]|uniref:Methyltransferase domain-containing protein n=1 Tax=Stenomitos frigidus ULC18 TaxID=2107698 RepID=A0A2T1DZ34_9CYAN|nr:class I SAM-dependent methyltransferase [Stenomitos frigidus]PSB25729.1 hypothetical protein C7B82_21940 [Stenomitos frigidus ULC18]
MPKNAYTSQIVTDYETLEPGETDSWNPLGNEYELAYRLAVFYALTQALEMSQISLRDLKVLDLGCGNGRSTRMYIDLGLSPRQLTGLDLRPGTIELAKKLNPGISYLAYDGETIPFPSHSFNWISVTTVFSSIKGEECRRHIVEQIYQALPPGGYVFYFDLRLINWFAGIGPVRPLQLFSKFDRVWYYPVKHMDFIPLDKQFRKVSQVFRSGDIKQFRSTILSLPARFLQFSHEALLVQKR